MGFLVLASTGLWASEAPAKGKGAAPKATEGTAPAKDVSELVITDVVKGNGTEAVKSKMVTVHYTGKLLDGTKFDSSLDRGTPFTFQLGVGQVIPGWEKGVAGMKVGGKRKLTIPSKDGYGERGAPPVIPPNSTLVFDVELLDVK
ncbi:MAG: FKBP-type peptidyl-prolyl cis-trans isomerase [Proteobacteria bacterium]|nr:FKBP-type peptidyl-prolyl cis-trans isomerase [Pseudomonadota bacterium]NDC23111.1 FKBP-type peptidyl-prolyl cis-trans isomerase [Pseudomonadota bacterium]NDD05131.1 FKBP-type peptidyl-prolyl cis-trans isomerase [Pseudomonadota bacterium]NDG26818.1 FKBP-type peptidyl-prolyl cis-trans isomerase [Pseudomonadota bacterium]